MSGAIETQGTKLGIKSFGAAVSVTFDADEGKIVRAAGDWTTVFAVGDILFTADGTNPGPFIVTAVTALDLTVTGDVATNAVAAEVTITGYRHLGEVTDFDGPGGSASVIDTTSLDSVAKEKLVGLPDEGQITFSLNFVPGNRGQVAFRQARRSRAETGFALVFSDTAATVARFQGFAMEWSVSGAVDDKVSASATIEITGAVSWSDEEA